MPKRKSTARPRLRAIFLLATLKKKQVLSNTQTLCEMVADILKTEQNVTSQIVRLRDYDIQPGTKTEIDNDDWPRILDRVLASDIVIFATPVWWGIQSSLMQRVIERLDELNDEYLESGKSKFTNKIGGIVITGEEDGAEHIIGNILNFMSWNGFTIPPAPSVSWLGKSEEGTKEALIRKLKRESIDDMARAFARNAAFLARVLRANPLPQKD